MRTPTTRAAAWTAALLVALAGLLAGGAGATATPLVTTAQNARLHAKILVNRSGLTLYHLSVEHKGHFICTNKTCLSFWHPLLVPKGTKPSGRVVLGIVQRHNGAIQVAYKGEPLYTFVQDKKRGDVKGEGFKDVGVWHAATVGSAATSSSGSGSGSGSGGGGYGGGYG
jgi:predicted lipoprotein with Yx(FWY)xxD motif